MSELLSSALAYVAAGLHILPLHWADASRSGGCSCGKPDCSSPGKHPFGTLTPNGLKNATTNPQVLRDWWDTFPRLNVGIATGEGSGIVVLDIDPKNGGTDSLLDLIRRFGDFSATRTVETGGGGLHFYFRHPGFAVRNQASNLGAGIDLRGDGGYVVAPPSNHASGTPYVWKDEAAALWPLPAWIATRDDDATRGGEAGSVPAVIGERIPKGRQHHTLVSLAGTLRRRGMPEAVLYAALSAANQLCEDPAPESHMRRMAVSVARYDPAEAFDAAMALDEPADGEGLEHIGDALIDLYHRLGKAVQGGGMMGLTTGLRALDGMLGGFHDGDLIMIAARPSMGKSSLARTLAVNQAEVCREGEGIATFSVEMSKQAYLLQMLGTVGDVDAQRFRTGEAGEAELQEAARAAGVLDALPLYLNAHAGISVAQMAAMCRAREAAGTRLRAVYVDYLQLVRAVASDGRRFNREDEGIAEVSKALKGLAKDLDCPVIALVQLNRAVESRGTGKGHRLSDLRGSGQLEQDADVVFFIDRPERSGETTTTVGLHTVSAEGLAIVDVAKQRLGPVGNAYLYFDRARTRFLDLAPGWLHEGTPRPAGALPPVNVHVMHPVEAAPF